MRNLSAIAPLILFVAVFPFMASAQQEPAWEVQALNQIIPGLPEGSVFYAKRHVARDQLASA